MLLGCSDSRSCSTLACTSQRPVTDQLREEQNIAKQCQAIEHVYNKDLTSEEI